MRAGWNTVLEAGRRRADPTVREMVEAVVVAREDVRRRKDEWQMADSLAGLTVEDDGRTHITTTIAALIENTVSDSHITDLNNTAPFTVAKVVFAGTDSNVMAIHRVKARLHPRLNGSNPIEVDRFVCRLYRLAEVVDPGLASQELRLQPLHDPVAESAGFAGSSEATFTFDLTASLPRPKLFGPPINGAGVFDDPTMFVFIWAVKADGSAAGNVGWAKDSATTTVTVASNVLSGTTLSAPSSQNASHYVETAYGGGVPRITIENGGFVQQTLTFSTNPIDLGVAPTDPVEVAVGAIEPGGTSLTTQINDTVGSGWVTCVDGDLVGQDNTPTGGSDLSSVASNGDGAGSWQMRVTFNPNAAGDETPSITALGLRERTIVDLDGLATIDGGRAHVDLPSLKSEIAEAQIRIIHDGVRDFRGLTHELGSDHYPEQIEFRVWIGAPEIARRWWMLHEVYAVDDQFDTGGELVFLVTSILADTRRTLPPRVDNGGSIERQAIEYNDQTGKAVWDDLVNNQLAIAARFRGPGIEDTTRTVDNVISDDTDAKDQLDALALIFGGTAGVVQGSLRFIDIFGPKAVVAEFPMAEVTMLNVGPAYRSRIPEMFASYAWDESSRQFTKQIRRFHGPSLTAVGLRGLDEPETLPSIVGRWLNATSETTHSLVTTVLTNLVDTMAAGIIRVRFTTTYAYPELTIGDMVALETDRFVARDPHTGRAIRGVVWLTGVLVAADRRGTDFELFVRSYADIYSAGESITRVRSGSKPQASAIVAGDVTATIRPGTTTVEVSVDVTGVGGVGTREFVLYMSGTSGFTVGAATRVGGPIKQQGDGTIVFAVPASTTWTAGAFLKVGIKDELTDAFGESEVLTAEIATASLAVVNFGRFGVDPGAATSDLLALFLFEEGQGTTIEDAAGNADASVAVAGAGWIRGPIGSAYDINAAGNITASHATAHDIGTGQDFTVDALLRWDGTFSLTQTIVNHDADYRLDMLFNSIPVTVLLVQTNVRDHANSASLAIDFLKWNLSGKWIHIKWQYDSSASTTTIWINGRKFPSVVHTGAAQTAAIGNDLEIGHNGGAAEWNGAIGYLRVTKGLANDFPRMDEVLAQPGAQTLTLNESANITLPAGDVMCTMDATAGARTVTLPSPADAQNARISVKKIDSSVNAVTVSGTIDGGSSVSLPNQYDSVDVISDGSSWWKV